MFTRDRRTSGEAAFDLFNVILMILLCLFMLYPVWYVLVNSLNDGSDALRGGIYFWPRMFSLQSYRVVLEDQSILRALWITVAKTVVGTLTHVFFTAMVAYAYSRKELIGRRIYMYLGTFTLFFSGGLIPYYLLIRDLHLLDSFLVYIIPALFSFFNLIIFLSFFREIPEGLEEAAKLDGANDLKIFIRIIIPVSMPVIATIALFTGVSQWNDYFTGVIFINDPSLQPVQTFLYRIVSESGSTQLQSGSINRTVTMQSIKLATMVVTTLPIVLVYPFLQKYFVKGFMIGSIKG
nr:carbohydrate ABC transporter permease [Paenibacillus rhizovicinus]